MPTEINELFERGELYFHNADGTVTPFLGISEVELSDTIDESIEPADPFELTTEIAFTLKPKRPTRGQARIMMRYLLGKTSRRAVGRPIRRIKRLKEKQRRLTLKES